MGLIVLPPRQREKINRKRIAPVPAALDEGKLCRLEGRVEAYRSIDLDMVRGGPLESLWDSVVNRYHYLGCSHIVGDTVKVIAALAVIPANESITTADFPGSRTPA